MFFPSLFEKKSQVLTNMALKEWRMSSLSRALRRKASRERLKSVRRKYPLLEGERKRMKESRRHQHYAVFHDEEGVPGLLFSAGAWPEASSGQPLRPLESG